jgi:hypothetical protein
MSHGLYTTSADILAQALVSDSPEIMQLDQLDPDTKLHIVTARLHGNHPVSVRWPGGQFALMFCEPGTNMPDPQKVITAYQQCLETKTTFPAGECK